MPKPPASVPSAQVQTSPLSTPTSTGGTKANHTQSLLVWEGERSAESRHLPSTGTKHTPPSTSKDSVLEIHISSAGESSSGSRGANLAFVACRSTWVQSWPKGQGEPARPCGKTGRRRRCPGRDAGSSSGLPPGHPSGTDWPECQWPHPPRTHSAGGKGCRWNRQPPLQAWWQVGQP